MGEQVPLQSGPFYTRHFILSACMNWTDCSFIVTDASRTGNWKKNQQSRIRINPKSWNLEIMHHKESWEKSQIKSVVIDETKDSENKVQYLQVNVGTEQVWVSGHREMINMFYCGIMYLLEEPLTNHPLVLNKAQEFQGMVVNARQFLNSGVFDTPPPAVPPPPQSLRFTTPLPEDPT